MKRKKAAPKPKRRAKGKPKDKAVPVAPEPERAPDVPGPVEATEGELTPPIPPLPNDPPTE